MLWPEAIIAEASCECKRGDFPRREAPSLTPAVVDWGSLTGGFLLRLLGTAA